MTTTRRKRKEDEGTFFLYVAFHAALTAIANLFNDD